MTSHMQRLGIIPYKKRTREQRLPEWCKMHEGLYTFVFWGNCCRDEANSNRIIMRFSHGKEFSDIPLPLRFMRRMTVGTQIIEGFPRYELPDRRLASVFFSYDDAKIIQLKECPTWIKDTSLYQGEGDSIGQQNILRFRHNDQLFFLPATEFIRKCYIANALRCDDVIYPGRMEVAARYTEKKDEHLKIHLLKRYHKAYITKGVAQFLAQWYDCLPFRTSFNSVANETILLPQITNHPVCFRLPKIGQLKLTCILKSRQKKHWVERIIDVKGIPISVRNVTIFQGARKSCFSVR